MNRRYLDDTWRKKVKGHFFKFIHKLIKDNLIIKVNRLPQDIITKVDIASNKILLESSIFGLYFSNKLIAFHEDEIESYFKQSLSQELRQRVKNYIFRSFEDSFNEFINSEDYRDLLKKLEKTKKWDLDKFDSTAKWLIHYYKTERPNLKKAK